MYKKFLQAKFIFGQPKISLVEQMASAYVTDTMCTEVEGRTKNYCYCEPILKISLRGQQA